MQTSKVQEGRRAGQHNRSQGDTDSGTSNDSDDLTCVGRAYQIIEYRPNQEEY